MSWSPTGYDAVVISESVHSENTEWLKFKGVGILTLEGNTDDDLGLADEGSSKGGKSTNMVIVDNTHPITQGFSGTVTVSINSKHLGDMEGWANDVTLLGHYEGSPEKAKLLVIDANQILTDGTTSPDKRVFYGVQFFKNLTVDGKTLFDNALTWVSQ